jgi:hypothetical protein
MELAPYRRWEGGAEVSRAGEGLIAIATASALLVPLSCLRIAVGQILWAFNSH